MWTDYRSVPFYRRLYPVGAVWSRDSRGRALKTVQGDMVDAPFPEGRSPLLRPANGGSPPG